MFVLMFVFHINVIKDSYIIFNTSQLFFIVTCTKRIHQKTCCGENSNERCYGKHKKRNPIHATTFEWH